ncbi:hypothetical protein Tco_1048461, partial [Tanacetum coccineum]
MESANPSCFTSNREFLDPKKKEEIESWLGDSRIVDSFDVANEIEYFDTFPTLEELEYHECLLKHPKPSWVKAIVSPFPPSDNDSNDEEVLYELIDFDGDDLAFECMIGFRKFTAYLEPFLPMNIISRKAYNTIMVEGLEGTGKNLVSIVKDVYVFVGSFTYISDFVVLKDMGEFIMSDMAEVLMGRPFRKLTKHKYDVAKGLVSFTKIFDTYTYRMPRTTPRLKNFNWSK